MTAPAPLFVVEDDDGYFNLHTRGPDGELEDIVAIVPDEADAHRLASAPALVEALEALLRVADIRDGRENEELHLSAHAFGPMWDKAKADAAAALSLARGGGE